MSRSAIRALLPSLCLLVARIAHADAVPPPPHDCPPGKIGITSHGGPECVAPAPKNCPPGWVGVIRGACVVQVCSVDVDCGAGKKCKDADVCTHEYLQEWGEESSAPGPRADRTLLGAPPRHFDPPRKVTQVVDVCGAEQSCPADSTCGKGKLCLPTGVSKPGRWSAQKPKK
jgi:hypothetical protein